MFETILTGIAFMVGGISVGAVATYVLATFN